MKFKTLLETILIEASKRDVLINKLGVKESEADVLSKITGPLSVFFAYKILESYEVDYYTDRVSDERRIQITSKQTAPERFALVNGSNSFSRERNRIIGIMDWVRVALNGNIKPYQELTFKELYDESERWHESLGTGESKFDYNETKDILLDFRKNGEGYYWVDLGTTRCPDEAERMGHCANSKGFLFSLRSFKKIENNHTLNKSHLTASINGETLIQLKGQKNSKPPKEYHSLILPLLYLKVNNEYFINKFGYEYNSENDFKISDLTEDEIKKLYSDRPELFKNRQEIKLLKKLGLIEPTKLNIKFIYEIEPKNADYYVTGDNKRIVKDILYGETYQYWNNYNSNEWKDAIDYYVNDENLKKIVELLKKKNQDIDINMDIKDAINIYDDDDKIQNAINYSVNDTEEGQYEDYLYEQLKKAFGKYGDVIEMSDEGVKIEIDFEKIISVNNIDDEIIDETLDDCGNNNVDTEFIFKCAFSYLVSEEYIEKPDFYLDEMWYPSFNKTTFNEILSDKLWEI